jgi:hypothetical protein
MVVDLFHQQVTDLVFAELEFIFIQQGNNGLVGALEIVKKIVQKSFVVQFAIGGQVIVPAAVQGTVQLKKMPMRQQAVQVIIVGRAQLGTDQYKKEYEYRAHYAKYRFRLSLLAK